MAKVRDIRPADGPGGPGRRSYHSGSVLGYLSPSGASVRRQAGDAPDSLRGRIQGDARFREPAPDQADAGVDPQLSLQPDGSSDTQGRLLANLRARSAARRL